MKALSNKWVYKIKQVKKSASAASEKISLSQFDISTAFLHGDIEVTDTIFMQQPMGYNDGSGRVCKLKKSLYGLKQAARCWYERFVNFLKQVGFTASDADPCLIRKSRQCKIIIALYIDDGIVASTDKGELEDFLEI